MAARGTNDSDPGGAPRIATSPDALLGELFAAYVPPGWQRPWVGDDRKARRIARGLPMEEWDATHQRELLAAEGELQLRVAQIRELRGELGGRLWRPDEYLARWEEGIRRWNHALYQNNWITLPALCEGCGVPVMGREGDRQTGEIAWVCSERCRQRRKARELRARKRKASP